jgi:hypothetical protein
VVSTWPLPLNVRFWGRADIVKAVLFAPLTHLRNRDVPGVLRFKLGTSARMSFAILSSGDLTKRNGREATL